MKRTYRTKTWNIGLAVVFLALAALLAACSTFQTTQPATPSETPTLEPAQTEAPAAPEEAPAAPGGAPAEDEEQLLKTPTIAPTATAGPITEMVESIIAATGLQQTRILFMPVFNWAELLISALIVILSFTAVFWLVYNGLKKLALTTATPYDERFLSSIRPQLRWFLGVLGLQFSTTRLLFLSPEIKQWLNQLYLTGLVLLASMALWKAITVFGDWYAEQTQRRGEGEPKEAVLILGQRALRLLVLFVALIIILDTYGVNVSALLTALGIGGLALSLAAQDTISNMISGVIILMDQPFRVGDRIEIQELNTWGDVIDIGIRSTRIRTRDNRMVIVPNSTISSNQVVNYTYPDPVYREQVELGIAYGSDFRQVRSVISEAVGKVEGVLPGRPVEVLFLAFGESAMTARVRWWMTSYIDTRRVTDRVNEAIYTALAQAGIETPPFTFAVEIVDPKKEDDPKPGQAA